MLAEQLCHRTGRFDRERRVPSQECPHLCAIFFLQHRAGNVGYPAFRLEQGYSPIEHLRLLLLTLLERARPHSPFGVGVTPPGSGTRARGVDKNEVHAPQEIVNFTANGFWRAHLNVPRARTLEAIMDRSEPTLIVVRCKNLALVLHHSSQCKSFAAGTGTKVDDLFARLGA